MPKKSRKAKDAGRLTAVFKYLTTLLNTGYSEQISKDIKYNQVTAP